MHFFLLLLCLQKLFEKSKNKRGPDSVMVSEDKLSFFYSSPPH